MSRRVLIKTLPLHTNYGGILQAYALQRVIRELGHEVVTDTTTPASLRRRLRFRYWALRRAVRRMLPLRFDWAWRAGHEVARRQRRFEATRLRQGRFVERAWSDRARARLARRFDTFLVGSDQVWRAYYTVVPRYLFDVLPGGDGGPRRVSYAASFGVDDLSEYSDAARVESASLLRRFDAVSVRERSGVRICSDEFAVRAERHVDPTMLLAPADYRALAVDAADAVGDPAVLVFRLDESDDLDAVESAIAGRLGLSTRTLLPGSPPSTYSAYAEDPAAYDRPSVERWLAEFSSAEFIVTDSFHGCVFAILFNRPFVAYANARRGSARFDTLLEVFDLRHHLVEAADDPIDDRVFDPDWESVNRILAEERSNALAYLGRVL
ncbi:polysaccharide pyruvyl transferase family protein [Agromyces mangrovi Wang et al. 2018]|uniref:polysaccharide pyruvyl transferase family protein n=1 Tax=Agromyces mangrovi TaxID=1858653 RepID=UPI00257425EB|nr:polysaccharide pyruvyl transferase family protein [Agromyces mangrovi]BDZ64535.1 MurB family protein [Agromyces mangrovi]